MTTTKTKIRANVESNTDSVSKMSIIVMATASGLIGLWALSCLVGAFISQGPVEVIKGFFSAIG